MADPVVHEVSTHPCNSCALPRVVQQCSWRDPAHAFSVSCPDCACGKVATGASLEDAVGAWDEGNPMRDVSAAEAHDAQCAVLQAHLSGHVMGILADAAAVFADSGQPQTMADFLAWCQGIAG